MPTGSTTTPASKAAWSPAVATATCALASCGDDYLYEGIEECDDANDDDTDACTSACTDAVCGDGFVHANIEECDLGNNTDDSACLSTCELATCGDGFLWVGMEVCDDPGEMPPTPTNVGAPVTAITGGLRFYCAIDTMSDLRCWGSNIYGQLGRGNTEPHGDDPGDMPAPIVNLGGVDVVLAEAGGNHVCAVLASQTTRCWGYNTNGQLGLGHTGHMGDGPGEMPPPAINLGVGIPVQLAAGDRERRRCGRAALARVLV
jgi:hypothetical protein